jgi:formylglycine-generating enzyme required for sulfatase activity
VPAGTYPLNDTYSVYDGGMGVDGGNVTVAAFRLDTYEITVGRFRKFVGAYTQTMIASGAGKGLTNIATVGSVSAGNGKWGQADMAGNVFEWVQDWWAPPFPASYPAFCDNCANLTNPVGVPARVLRGGSFNESAGFLPAAWRSFQQEPWQRNFWYGARCARTP